MNVIFLDIDGVLNSRQSIKRKFAHATFCGGKEYTDTPDKQLIKRINKIVKVTNAKIVITSTWRLSNSIFLLSRYLHALGLKGDIIDATPYMPMSDRGLEIEMWLISRRDKVGTPKPMSINLYENIDRFVIIDDDSDMGALADYLVKVDNDIGVSNHNVKQAIKIMTTKTNPYISKETVVERRTSYV
jgi:hypothetical protein